VKRHENGRLSVITSFATGQNFLLIVLSVFMGPAYVEFFENSLGKVL
jgi:hypothetical protein